MQDKHTVTIGNTAFTCHEGESILEAMERAGCKGIFVGCRRGGCGACKVKIETGSVELLRPMSREYVSQESEQEGNLLACCASPKTDLVLEVE